MTEQGHEQQPTPVDPSVAAAGTAPDPAPAPAPAPTDPDLIELQEALAAAQAEDAAAKAAGADPVTGQQPAPQPQPPGQKPTAQAEVPMIPKPRLDEALARATKAEQDAAYYRGIADARAAPAPAPGGQQQQQPQPTPEQRIAAINQATDELAAKFDNGEITMTDFKRQERELDNQAQAIREESLLTKVRPAAPAQSGDGELYLETLTASLEQQHPWVMEFEAVGTDADWNYLKAQAISNLASRGVDASKGVLGRYELRKEIAVLADEYGPALLSARLTKAGRPVPGQATSPPTQPQGKPPLSDTAQARLTKLERAAGAPPNLTAMTGAGGPAAGQFSESQIEAMSDEEIGNLPDAVRRKHLGLV